MQYVALSNLIFFLTFRACSGNQSIVLFWRQITAKDTYSPQINNYPFKPQTIPYFTPTNSLVSGCCNPTSKHVFKWWCKIFPWSAKWTFCLLETVMILRMSVVWFWREGSLVKVTCCYQKEIKCGFHGHSSVVISHPRTRLLSSLTTPKLLQCQIISRHLNYCIQVLSSLIFPKTMVSSWKLQYIFLKVSKHFHLLTLIYPPPWISFLLERWDIHLLTSIS